MQPYNHPYSPRKRKTTSDSMTGEQLKLYLDHNKVVKRQLALDMGISRQSLNQYFSAKSISTEVLEAVADALNTQPEVIYREMRDAGIL